MRRAGALLAAVAMVVGAFAVRDRVTGGDGDGSRDRRAALLCPTEFEAVCREVTGDLRIEDAGVTADRLITADSADDLGARSWVVPAAWARLVVDERARQGDDALFEITDALASTPVVQVVWRDVVEDLRRRCGRDVVGWDCVGRVAAERAIRAGGPPVDSATGLPLAAAQMGGVLGRSDYAVNDFDSTVHTFAAAFAEGQTGDALTVMRTRGPGALGVVVAAAAEAGTLRSNFGDLDAIEGPATVDLVLLVPAGDRSQLVDPLRRAFVGAGWDAPTGGPDGLPANGSVLAAVRTLWKEYAP